MLKTLNVPMDDVKRQLQMIKKINLPVIVVRRSGSRSDTPVSILEKCRYRSL